MKKIFFAGAILLFSIASYSQSKGIVGSWLWKDSVNSIHFFLKRNGIIEKRSGVANENIWAKTPQIGTYTFKNKQSIIVTWATKKTETIKVKFVGKNAEFQFLNQKISSPKPYLFLRIVDEEVISEN